MPQPLTHYLVIRRAIPREYWSIWWDKYKPYFGLGSSSPDLFYFPSLGLRTSYNRGISDRIHADFSYDLFCTMLDIAKTNKFSNAATGVAEKQFAFSVGLYSHVVADCIFHPYIYRSTRDHWYTRNPINEAKHKKEEFCIDRGIQRKIYGQNQEIGTIKWKCPGESDDLLEFAVADLYNTALTKNYPALFSADINISNEDNPIQQAYRALNEEMPLLLRGEKLFLWRSGISISFTTRDMEESFFTKKYPPLDGLDPYSPEDLFNFSCAVSRNIFLKALAFLDNTEVASAKEYFRRHKVDYLASGNWNLDTGLPSAYNNDPLMLIEAPEHYLYKVDELKRQYLVFNELYAANQF